MKTIKLKERYIERLNTHLWIFSNEIAKHDFTAENGEICRIVYNDDTQCGIGFYNPHSLISVRLLLKGKEDMDEHFFLNCLNKAFDYRKSIGIVNGRFFFGESDGIGGLVIDKYNSVITVQILSAGVEKSIKEIIASIKEIYNPEAIVILRNHHSRILEGLAIEPTEIIGKLTERIIIEENGAMFNIDIINSQKTGWYFDQRDNREFLIPYFKDKKVLDLYCYTGAFSIIAAKNGANFVLGIDSSKKAVETAETNRELNKISEETLVFKEENALNVLDGLSDNDFKDNPDFILLDPPNLVHNKKHLNDAKRLYIKMLKSALKTVKPAGYVAFSTCSQHISDEIFNEIIETAAIKSQRRTFNIYIGTQSKDHPIIAGMRETKYLHFVLLNIIK